MHICATSLKLCTGVAASTLRTLVDYAHTVRTRQGGDFPSPSVTAATDPN